MVRILVVDDENEIADEVAQILKERIPGISVDVTYTGRGARAMLADNYDIIVTDIGMPVIGGFELLTYIIENKLDTGVIFLTGYQEFDTIYRASQYKDVKYIVKAENEDKLVSVVNDMIAARELSKHNALTIAQANEKIELAARMLTIENVRRHVRDADDALSLKDDMDRTTRMVMNVKDYVARHLEDDITLTSIARDMHFNPTYLSRVFSAGTGRTLSDYILAKKMEAAKQYLLSGDAPVSVISERLGYQSAQAFARAFRKFVNMTPMDYRRMHADD